MIVSLRKWIQFAKFAVVFLLLTYVMVQLIQVLSLWIHPVQRYKEPIGKSVKVFQQSVNEEVQLTMGERLKQFYRDGE